MILVFAVIPGHIRPALAVLAILALNPPLPLRALERCLCGSEHQVYCS